MLVAGFLVMFMQVGFAMLETGFTRAKNAVNTMAMNFIIYPIGIFGFWFTGYGLMMGGVGHWPSLGATAIRASRTFDHYRRASYGLLGLSKFALLNVSHDPSSLAMFLFAVVVHGYRCDHSDRRDGGALEVLRLRDLRPFHVDVPLSSLWQLGLGWRMALATRRQSRPGTWPSSISPDRRWCI